MTLALLAVLGAIVVGFILFPIFTRADGDAIVHRSVSETELLDLSEKKARILGAIQDLDFEKASGKLSDADYDTARNDYMSQVAALMARIDEIAPAAASTARASAGEENETACASCGGSSPASAKFCVSCGNPFSRACPACGQSVPATAKFCSECGAPVEKVNA